MAVRLPAANRGMVFERMVEISNAMYRHHGLAEVDKVPTPTIVNPEKGHACYSGKSTVDFVGCWAQTGLHLAFDCKRNHEATRFPFDTRWAHEVEHLRRIHQARGIDFLLIEQAVERKVYLLPGPWLFVWWDRWLKHGGRGSIPTDLIHRLPPVPQSTAVPVDYLAVVAKTWPDLWAAAPPGD